MIYLKGSNKNASELLSNIVLKVQRFTIFEFYWYFYYKQHCQFDSYRLLTILFYSSIT